MNSIQVRIVAVLLSLCMALLTDAVAISDHKSRTKRQTADVRTAEYLARMALNRALTSYGCENLACGVVDIYRSGKKKRAEAGQGTDGYNYDLLTDLLQRRINENQ